MKEKILPLSIGFLMMLSSTVCASQKNIDAFTKINSNIEELGFKIDNDVPEENYVVRYELADKKILVPYSTLQDKILTFRAPQATAYELIDNTKKFSDVKNYSADIAFVSAREILCGIDEKNFAPELHMTRAMFAQALANLDGADLSSFTAPNFTDVDKNSWYAPAISWLISEDLYVTNENTLLFKPNEPITREDMISILYRYAQSKNFLLWQPGLAVARPPFADLDTIVEHARDAAVKLNWAGIVLVDEENNFAPKSFTTRAEVSSLIKRFVERMTQLN